MFLRVLSTVPSLLGLRRPAEEAVATRLMGHLAAASRAPVFYADWGVPDTLEGRFDMLTLHVIAALERLKPHDQDGKVSQALFDAMIDNLDANLREMGVGDDGVRKRIRALTEMFYGRAAAYRAALAEEDPSTLAAAVGRNILGDADAPGASDLADYFRDSSQAGSDDAAIALSGGIAFQIPDRKKDQ